MATTVHLISDFNIEILERTLANAEGAALTVDHAPFGQVFQSLSRPPAGPGVHAVVWTRPEAILDGYNRALQMAPVPHEEVLAEVDGFAAQLVIYARQVRALFVPTWVLPVGHRGYGVLDHRPGLGLAYLLARMNLRLAERLAACANAFVLDTERWLRAAGARAASAKLWYASKVPFGNPVFAEATVDLLAAIEGLGGRARRLVVLDLDHTLWGGVVGETGWAGVVLGGHDHVGEAYVDFQRGLRALSARGVQLAIVSKNDEATALATLDHHPEMVLRRKDLAGWRINWNDKAANLVELVEELNLGLASVVFIDDSAIERGRVREALPQVLVPDWPEDPALYTQALLGLRCFDSPSIEAEDRARTAMYVAERQRRASQGGRGGQIGSAQSPQDQEAWLRSLELEVTVEPLTAGNLARASQLFNKTNQMNLATRRLSDIELTGWVAQAGRWLWTFSVTDRFGASGLTGIVSLQVDKDRAEIVDFILSCRVMGRNIEETMLAVAVAHARRMGVSEIRARYRPTARNGPCLGFWAQHSGFAQASGASAGSGGTPGEAGETWFVWDARRGLPLPEVVNLRGQEAP